MFVGRKGGGAGGIFKDKNLSTPPPKKNDNARTYLMTGCKGNIWYFTRKKKHCQSQTQ